MTKPKPKKPVLVGVAFTRERPKADASTLDACWAATTIMQAKIARSIARGTLKPSDVEAFVNSASAYCGMIQTLPGATRREAKLKAAA